MSEFKSDKGLDNLFKGPENYFDVVDVIKDLYISDGSLQILMDFERLLDNLDIYAYRNWILGELVQGPEISRYQVSCTFLWPHHLMPDPKAGKRLIPFGCKISYKKTTMKVPVKIKSRDDFEPGTKMNKLKEVPIWLVEITIPKELISDIRSGSVEMEDEVIDLEDLDLAYEENQAGEELIDNDDEAISDEAEEQSDLDDLEL